MAYGFTPIGTTEWDRTEESTTTGGSGSLYAGNGDPNGVTTADAVPAIYIQEDSPGTLWAKAESAGTNTGWVVNAP